MSIIKIDDLKFMRIFNGNYQKTGKALKILCNFYQFCNIYIKTMCYLKNIMPERNLDFDIWTRKEVEVSQSSNQEKNMLIPCTQKHMGIYWTEEQQTLVNIFEIVNKNNALIAQMNKLLYTNSQQLGKIIIKSEKDLIHLSSSSNSLPESEEFQPKSLVNEGSLLSKLFGSKKYKFSLQPTQAFQTTIYKERNFNIDIKLINKNGKVIRNSNLLTLCFAVCTLDAEWVHENRVGESFMKGKTQIELFKGESSFQKLYAREVSRIYPQGKVAIIIYAKPSAIKYSATGPCEQFVSSDEIEPLIIQNISIRAKRKQ